MPQRKIIFRSGEYYHLYNRGVDRQAIFFNDGNRSYFIRKIRQYFLPDLIEIMAYCLMPNHYHMMVRLLCDGLPEKIMQPFGASYTKAVNKQTGRVGPLFQGRFKAKLVDKNEWLLHLSRYIHLNPVFAGLVNHPAEYLFSSYRDYIGLRKGTLLKTDIVLSRFPSRQAYAKFVESYSEKDGKRIAHLMLD